MMNYYHLKYKEVLEMSVVDFEFFYECMVKAQATERIKDLDLHTIAYATPKRQKEIVKKLYDEATPEEEKKERVVTTQDLKKFGFDAVAGAPR